MPPPPPPSSEVWQKYESLMRSATSPGSGFCRFPMVPVSCLHLSRSTHSAGFPVGRWQDASGSSRTSSDSSW